MIGLLSLFWEFLQIGLFSVGGGLATLPFLYRLSDKTGWFTYAQIADMLAVSESTPGAIGVNMATYAGFRNSGIPGALIATLGLILPSIIISVLVARVLVAFKANLAVKAAFAGFRPAATGLIAAAGFGVLALSLYEPAATLWYTRIRLPELVLFAGIFILLLKTKRHPIVYIAIAGAVGVVLGL